MPKKKKKKTLTDIEEEEEGNTEALSNSIKKQKYTTHKKTNSELMDLEFPTYSHPDIIPNQLEIHGNNFSTDIMNSDYSHTWVDPDNPILLHHNGNSLDEIEDDVLLLDDNIVASPSNTAAHKSPGATSVPSPNTEGNTSTLSSSKDRRKLIHVQQKQQRKFKVSILSK